VTARRGVDVGLVTAVVLALCVGLAAADVVLWLRGRDKPSSGHAQVAAVAAARQAVRDILSYDYRTLKADIAKAKSETTGLFAKQYAGSAEKLLAQAGELRAIVRATPSTAGIVSATADEVVVLIFVDQASVKQQPGQKTPSTRIDQSRVRMTMTEVDGRWKLSQLAAL
jgi:Mce-associated membrane protein